MTVYQAYPRAVPAEGNKPAKEMPNDVFEVTDRTWRGIGMIPRSGWRLSAKYREFDAKQRFQVQDMHTAESSRCRSGEGAAFGNECTPRNPRGRRWCPRRVPARRTASTAASSSWDLTMAQPASETNSRSVNSCPGSADSCP